MSWWTRFWLFWAIIVVGGFAAIEAPAVLNDERGDTLTEHIVEYVPGEFVFFPVLGALFVWVLYHFIRAYQGKHRK